jgi:hypothetical protein
MDDARRGDGTGAKQAKELVAAGSMKKTRFG